ncbi:MAG TPA: acyltransferase [Burkholderiaceae bacterium]|jgi:peptidoglycan/LPS O-acetylase OafA/YrhL
MKMAAHRNWGIDSLRGLSILLVLLNHLGLGFRLPLKKSLLIEVLPKSVLNAVCFNGYEAVFIFFVISGFLITSRVLEQSGTLHCIDWRGFYRRRAARIVPLLLALLAVLAVLHVLGFADYRISAPGQSLGGALWSAIGLHLNWYEGQTTWLPASWDVLWSLSIEEVFYLAFPLLCLWVPRRALVILLGLLALSLPVSRGALAGNEIWQEKAYLPGMSAIATGVLCALVAQAWPRLPAWAPRALLALGGAGLGQVLFGLAYKWLGQGNMLLLTGSAAALVLACHHLCQATHAPRSLQWLAKMGRLSYEIYLSHMFVVLSAVAIYRSLVAPDMRWDFLVYPVAIGLAVKLGAFLERWVTQPCEQALRGAAPANPGSREYARALADRSVGSSAGR